MNTKKIKILTHGILPMNGFICGPILTPYNESIDTIHEMVSKGIEVVEVTEDGSEVKLTRTNISDNKKPAQQKSKQKEKPVVEEKVVEKVSEVVEDVPENKEEVPEEEKKEPEINEKERTNDEVPQYHNRDKKRNKFNR